MRTALLTTLALVLGACAGDAGSAQHADLSIDADAAEVLATSEATVEIASSESDLGFDPEIEPGADELVVGSVIADDAVKLCDAGYRLDFLLCDGADHVEGAAESLPVQLQWAMARIAGEPMDAVCDTDDVQDCSVYFDF